MKAARRIATSILAFATLTGCHMANAAGDTSIVFVGDVMLDDGPGRVVAHGRDPFGPFAAHIDDADLRIANLECVVARGGTVEPDKPWTFRAHPRVLRPLARHFDAVSLANNHSGDYGPAAFAEMLGRLDRHGIAWFGGGHDLAEAHRPRLIERNGLRIALLGYDEFFPRSFEAQPDTPGVAWSEDDQVVRDLVAMGKFLGSVRDIADARRAGADLVIPFMHWGWEHETTAAARQRHLARLMIDAGADAVIGGHPHVVQDVEIHGGRPIVYSLGNFLFDGFDAPINNTGWLLRLAVDREGVRRAEVVVARIDRKGVPHPVRDAAPCWQRGAEAWTTCAPAPPQRSLKGR